MVPIGSRVIPRQTTVSFLCVVPFASLNNSFVSFGQSAATDHVDFEVVFTGYRTKWLPNSSKILENQDQLTHLVLELQAPEFIPYLHDLLPESDRPDFNPVVDFSQYVVVAVAGQRHEASCQKTTISGVIRTQGDAIEVDVQEQVPALCPNTTRPVGAHQVNQLFIRVDPSNCMTATSHGPVTCKNQNGTSI